MYLTKETSDTNQGRGGDLVVGGAERKWVSFVTQGLTAGVFDLF